MKESTSAWQQFWQHPLVWFGLVADLVILDQIFKYVARTWWENPVWLVGDWVSLRYVENTGVAFSLPVPGGISSLLAVVVSLWLGWELFRRQLATSVRLAYSLIIAGALGNLIDRLWYGAVTDFMSVGTFPVFNLADSFICVGVALFLWHEVMSG